MEAWESRATAIYLAKDRQRRERERERDFKRLGRSTRHAHARYRGDGREFMCGSSMLSGFIHLRVSDGIVAVGLFCQLECAKLESVGPFQTPEPPRILGATIPPAPGSVTSSVLSQGRPTAQQGQDCFHGRDPRWTGQVVGRTAPFPSKVRFHL